MTVQQRLPYASNNEQQRCHAERNGRKSVRYAAGSVTKGKTALTEREED